MTTVTRRAAIAGAIAMTASGPVRAGEADPRYSALALQTRCDAVNQDSSPEDARSRMMASIARLSGEIAVAQGFLRTFNGTNTRLVVLPEYVLTGFPLGESREEWKAKAAIDPGGAEYEALAEIAIARDIWLAGNAYETDANFPEIYFQSCFVIAPSGDTILRYRRMISLFTPTPYDVWDDYLDVYGYDAVFPVVETEIGVLAAIASEEILYPEIARMFAMKGAEILLHPTSEVGEPALTVKDVAKRARAVESMAYVVSANTASIEGTPLPAASTTAMSKVVDWNGRVLAAAEAGESMVANAVIDLPAQRAARGRTGMSQMLARQPFAAYAPSYDEASDAFAPPNALAEGRADALTRQQRVIDQLRADGVIR